MKSKKKINQELIKKIFDFAAACYSCADACLDDVKKMVRCIRLDKLCATACVATAEAVSVKADKNDIRGLVEYCKETCRKCEDERDQHEPLPCRDYAKACKECVEACDKFLA